MNKTTIDKKYTFLLKIGFSLNEAKIYLALLEKYPLNGYEVSKYSGVARSLVYDCLDRLVSKGYVIKMEGETNFYKPLNYEKLIDTINKENQSNLLIAREELKKYSKSNNDDEFIFNIKGFEEFIKKTKELILNAKKEISLSIWKNDFELIKEELEIVKNKGVSINIFSFSDISLENANNFTYRLSDPENLFPYRRISIVIDEKETLVGQNNGEKSISLYTRNHSITSLVIDEIVLNIFWYKLFKVRNLLPVLKTSKDFLSTLNLLKKELDIDTNMTKNFMVYNFQFGGDDNEG